MNIYTHRGTKEHIQACLDRKCIIKHKQEQSWLTSNLFDHDKECVWVSEGKAKFFQFVLSGMIQYGTKRRSYITFEYNGEVKRPKGKFKLIFGGFQRVIEDDIDLSNNIIDKKVY